MNIDPGAKTLPRDPKGSTGLQNDDKVLCNGGKMKPEDSHLCARWQRQHTQSSRVLQHVLPEIMPSSLGPPEASLVQYVLIAKVTPVSENLQR